MKALKIVTFTVLGTLAVVLWLGVILQSQKPVCDEPNQLNCVEVSK